jgi:hypothetical protein
MKNCDWFVPLGEGGLKGGLQFRISHTKLSVAYSKLKTHDSRFKISFVFYCVLCGSIFNVLSLMYSNII